MRGFNMNFIAKIQAFVELSGVLSLWVYFE